jgi:hypothetical protein
MIKTIITEWHEVALTSKADTLIEITANNH